VAARKIVTSSQCARQSDTGFTRPLYRLGWLPVPKNYKTFALTANGIAVGFDQGDVAGESCGSVEVVVPYKPVLPYMNSFGKRLVFGVRQAWMK
jgi:hypothetical protein